MICFSGQNISTLITVYYTVSIILSIISIFAAVILAKEKNRSVAGCVLLCVFFGWLGLIIVSFLSPIEEQHVYRPLATSKGSEQSKYYQLIDNLDTKDEVKKILRSITSKESKLFSIKRLLDDGTINQQQYNTAVRFVNNYGDKQSKIY